MAALSEIKALLGESQFNWSDPMPWIQLQQEFGIEFPVDFREIVDAYGSIQINGQLYLEHPAGHLLHSLGETIRGDLEMWREGGMAEFLPAPAGGNPGELMPVASAATGEWVFLRVPGGPSLPWRVLVQELDSPAWVLHEMTFSDWLLAYLRGEDVTVCSRNTAPGRPFWEFLA
ncbi:SMI1/KNR4 family protein [Streptomyces sp. SAT1]|uniref:SMI1/KNR4 family protein n=1 Tax=Streptomyces sp. SAT1 TaxID=1849967 RepID=UPI001F223969|nr:SMI1/KNR4 family protein [Streptomyces sp. SAT1]